MCEFGGGFLMLAPAPVGSASSKEPEQLWSPIYLVNGSSSQHRYAQDDEVGTANLFFLDTFCCIRKTATLEAPRT